MNREPTMLRIFVVLTGAEATALGALQVQVDATLGALQVQVDAIHGLAKIRTALEHAKAAALSPEPSALTVPPLRAKHYRPRVEPLRMAKAVLRPVDDVLRPVDDYVPWRDEVGGIHS